MNLKDKNYNQLVIWRGTIVGEENIKEFEEFFHDEGFRVKYATEFKTLAGNGGEGGRQDVLFYIHDEDVKKFAMYRLKREGMSWWEDAIDNENKIFPERILDKYQYSWN
jgi:hypothetical protein